MYIHTYIYIDIMYRHVHIIEFQGFALQTRKLKPSKASRPRKIRLLADIDGVDHAAQLRLREFWRCQVYSQPRVRVT